MDVHPLTLLLGGARSGKSRYAQTLAAEAAKVLFIATAQPGDEEMQRKIERHRAGRTADGLRWTLVEEPLRLGRLLETHTPEHGIIVIDCLTLFVASLLAAGDRIAIREMESFYKGLACRTCPVVLVSNEVGSGVVPKYASGRAFRDLLGELNQKVAALATDVFLLVAGLPLRLKGGL